MRQYRRGRRNIAINVGGAALALALGASTVLAQSEVPDHQWHAQMAAEAVQQQGMPPVEVSPVSIDGNVVSAELRVQPWLANNSLDFVLTLPAGEITSATLTPVSIAGAGASVTTSSETGASRDITATIRHLGYVRGNRLVRVQAMAAVPGAAGAKMQTGVLKIAYEDAVEMPARTRAEDQGHDVFRGMLEQLVANPEDVARLTQPLERVPLPKDESPVPLGGYPDAVARFEVGEDAFTRFSGADLARAGVELSAVTPERVSVWSNGEQVPLLRPVSEGGARPVQPDDAFLLYATDNESTYTIQKDYWVRILDQPGLSMDVEPGETGDGDDADADAWFWSEMNVEEDVPPVLTKNDQFLTILGFRWVWWTWTPTPDNSGALPGARGYETSGSLQFGLDGLATPEATSAPLTLHFYAHRWSMNSSPVTFAVEVNGQQVGRVAVSDPGGLEHTVDVPVGLLRPAGNEVALIPEVAPNPDMPELCFDRMEIRYPRDYRMTSNTLEFYPPASGAEVIALQLPDNNSTSVVVADMSGGHPRLLSASTGDRGNIRKVQVSGPDTRRHLAVTDDAVRRADLQPVRRTVDLLSPENRADLVVIAWPDFIADLKPWLDDKTSKGHVVKVINVFDIYNQFGYGHESPFAIREFLRHAMVNWQGSPKGSAASVVMLVGDSTSAYRNEFRNDVINYVPTMRLNVTGDPFASDQWLVSLFGDDTFADALVGRFSVNNREDLRTVIQKQLEYQNNPKPGAWQNTLGFVADHSEFEDSVNRVMMQVVPPRFFLDRIMMSELPWIDNYYFPKEIADARKAKVSPEATGRIRDMFNNGAAVVTYFGHGSPNIWGNERMWFGGDSPNSDNLLLNNRDKLSIVINMTCNSGAIDYPQPRWNVAISEDFMRVPNGGAVACFVPSGPGLTVQHERLMMEVGRLLFDRDQQPLGQSLQLAMWRYLAGGNPAELAQMFILLGDPLLVPNISSPVDSTKTTRRGGASWPGTIALPPDVIGSPTGGNYQINQYGKNVSPGEVGSFTSATVALPMAPASTVADARSIVFSVPDDEQTTAVESTFTPVSPLKGLRLVQWRRTDAAGDDSTATLELRLQNGTPLPMRRIRVQVVSAENGAVLGQSGETSFAGFAEVPVSVDVPASPGLTKLRALVTDGENQHALISSTPMAVVGLRPDSEREKISPAVVDPRSVSVRYRKQEASISATVSAQIYTLAREPLSNLRVGLEDESGLVVQDSVMTVPAVTPGDNVRISLSLSLSPEAPSQRYTIRFDPTGFYPEFQRFEPLKVPLGRQNFADLVIALVTPVPASPVDGETVFFDVAVANQGDALADGVRVEGTVAGAGAEPVELESQVNLMVPLLTLEPGTTESVRLRWDPFRNAGDNQLTFSARSIYEMPDRNENNNTQSLKLDVRSKARLRSVEVGVLPMTPEDMKNRQVRFLGRLKNEGEADAHGLRVRFYASAEMKESDYLGDVELERIKPGETKDAIFVYKPKPGQEDRPINVTIEVVYKGSRQRVPMN